MGADTNTSPMRKRVLSAFLLALVLRCLAVLLVGDWDEPSPGDRFEIGWETGRIADHLARGHGFALDLPSDPSVHASTAWLAPAYPWIVSLFFRVFGPYSSAAILGVLLLQALLSSLNVLVLARLGTALGRPRAGLWAALLLALSPSAINMSTRILWSTSLLTLEGSLLMLWVLRHREQPGWGRAIGIGVLTGVTLLTEPAPAAFILGLAVWSCCRTSSRVRGQVFAASAIAFLCVLPWTIRNANTLGSIFLMKSNLGNELYIGNGPGATGDYVRPFALIRERHGVEELERLRSLTEVERSDELGRRAKTWIREHPTAFLGVTLRRIRGYWLRPMLDDWKVLGLGRYEGIVGVAYRIGSGSILLLAGWGCWRALRSRGHGLVLIFYVALFPVAYYLTHVSITRYRFPVLPAVFLLATLALDSRVLSRDSTREPRGDF